MIPKQSVNMQESDFEKISHVSLARSFIEDQGANKFQRC
jgi:hypothetical protein